MSDLVFTASKTSAEFMLSNSFGRILAGPLGSGKTVTLIMECLRRAIEQKPAPDGIKYTRFAIIRQTLRSLKETVLRDCESWLCSRGLATWKVSESVLHVNFDNVRSEWIFIPLEDAKDQNRLLSMQLTAAWFSELVEMNIDILGPVSGRLGRYPSGNRGSPTYFGWMADTNMPTEMTAWHQFFENLPADISLFRQPGGLSPNAENLEWLVQTDQTLKLPAKHPVRQAQGRKYYERLVEIYGTDSAWAQRYIHAEYGPDPGGQAVFKATWNTQFHSVDETTLIPGHPILIGQDFGRNPWSLICQVDHMGRLLVHQEVPATNMGLEKHVTENLRPILYTHYLGYRVAIVGDPSGVAKGSIAEESCFDALRRLGLPAFPAPTNDIDARLRAVEALLGRQIGGTAALLVSRKGCPWLCRAMAGGYRYKVTKEGGLKATPEKNDKEGYSHIVDDLQYVSLVVHGGMVNYVYTHLQPKPNYPVTKISAMAWT